MARTSKNPGRGPRRSREQWRQVIAEQADSGLSQSAFCAERGIAYSTFTFWKRKLREAGSPGDGARGMEFVELAPLEPAVNERWEVELELGSGLTLRLRGR
jgi:putative transposase